MVHTLNLIFSVLMWKMGPVQDLKVLLQAIAFVENSPKRLAAYLRAFKKVMLQLKYSGPFKKRLMVDMQTNNITNNISAILSHKMLYSNKIQPTNACHRKYYQRAV
jgi:hypothetical protein